MRAKHYFTLIEMLVVIAIISILASMLMPSLGKAIDSAKNIQCSSNLKQLNTGLTMYSSDFNGNFAIYKVAYSNLYTDGAANPFGAFLLSTTGYLGIDNSTAKENSELIWCPNWKVAKSWLACYNSRPMVKDGQMLGFTGSMSTITGLLALTASQVKKPSELTTFADPMQKLEEDYFMHGEQFNAAFLDGHVMTINDSTQSVKSYMSSSGTPYGSGSWVSRNCFRKLEEASGISTLQF